MPGTEGREGTVVVGVAMVAWAVVVVAAIRNGAGAAAEEGVACCRRVPAEKACHQSAGQTIGRARTVVGVLTVGLAHMCCLLHQVGAVTRPRLCWPPLAVPARN